MCVSGCVGVGVIWGGAHVGGVDACAFVHFRMTSAVSQVLSVFTVWN